MKFGLAERILIVFIVFGVGLVFYFEAGEGEVEVDHEDSFPMPTHHWVEETYGKPLRRP